MCKIVRNFGGLDNSDNMLYTFIGYTYMYL